MERHLAHARRTRLCSNGSPVFQIRPFSTVPAMPRTDSMKRVSFRTSRVRTVPGAKPVTPGAVRAGEFGAELGHLVQKEIDAGAGIGDELGVGFGSGEGFGVSVVHDVDGGDAVVVAVGDEEAGHLLVDVDPDNSSRARDGPVEQRCEGGEFVRSEHTSGLLGGLGGCEVAPTTAVLVAAGVLRGRGREALVDAAGVAAALAGAGGVVPVVVAVRGEAGLVDRPAGVAGGFGVAEGEGAAASAAVRDAGTRRRWTVRWPRRPRAFSCWPAAPVGSTLAD
jgi:hypothetical protein